MDRVLDKIFQKEKIEKLKREAFVYNISFRNFLAILDDYMQIKIVPENYYDESLGCNVDNNGEVIWYSGLVKDFLKNWNHGKLNEYEITGVADKNGVLEMWISKMIVINPVEMFGE